MESKGTSTTPRGFKSKEPSAWGEGKEDVPSHHRSEPKPSASRGLGSKYDSRAEKAALIERELDEEVDQEFESLLRQPNVGTIAVSADPFGQRIAAGFRINFMNMRDGSTGRLIWESSRFGPDMFEREIEESIPKEIMSCRIVSREINFTSMEPITNFRLEQRVFFQGQVIEEWLFSFGFVIPGSTNNWQQVIEAAPPEQMIAPEILSGKVTFETAFFDGPMFLCKNLVRIFYV